MREGFYIGDWMVHYYGIIIMLGVLAASYLASRLAANHSQDPEVIWDCMPWLLLGGIVGARLWHIATPPASMVARGITFGYYLTHPLDAIAIWNGGVGIPGAVIGGALALYWYTRSKRLSFAMWVDFIAPGLALAQAIGRWGNFINQELYGAPSNLPWAIFIEPAKRLAEYQTVEYYHPLFLYESLWNLLNMGVLLLVGRRWRDWLKPGDIFSLYMIIYPVGRFYLEFLRLDPSPVAGLNVNQSLMAVTAVLGVVLLITRHHKSNQVEVDPQAAAETPVSELNEE